MFNFLLKIKWTRKKSKFYWFFLLILINLAEKSIDILVNNAGIMFYPKYEKTVDGHEMHWQTNHLGESEE